MAVWAGVSATDLVSATELPPPWTVVKTMVSELDAFWPDIVVTTKAWVLALVISVVSGVAVGVAIVDSKLLERVVYPMLVGSQVLPKIAIAPIMMVWLGFGIASNTLIGVLIAFFPVVLATVVGLRTIEPALVHLSRAMGASWLRTLVRVRLPSALPSIMPGVRLATIYALTGVLVGEFIGGDEGIGRRILGASASFDAEVTFAASAYVVLMGFAAFALLTLAEGRWLKRFATRTS